MRVFQIDGQGLSWERFGQVIYSNNVLDNFGMSVDITANGMTIICGSPRNHGFGDRPGYARVFSLVVGNNNIGTGSWKQIGGDIIGEANSDWFGYSVSLSNNGKALAVGARTNNGNKGRGSGHMRVYRRDADSEFGWMQLGNNINGEVAYDDSGGSVSLSADGNTVAISSPYNYDNGISSFFPSVIPPCKKRAGAPSSLFNVTTSSSLCGVAGRSSRAPSSLPRAQRAVELPRQGARTGCRIDEGQMDNVRWCRLQQSKKSISILDDADTIIRNHKQEDGNTGRMDNIRR